MFKKIIKLAFVGLAITTSFGSQSSRAMETIDFSSSETTERKTSMRSAMDALSSQNPFAFFDLELSE